MRKREGEGLDTPRGRQEQEEERGKDLDTPWAGEDEDIRNREGDGLDTPGGMRTQETKE